MNYQMQRMERLYNEYPECDQYECHECMQHKKEIYSMEDCFDCIRDNIEQIVYQLGSKDLMNKHKICMSLLSICSKLGVEYKDPII